MNDSEKNHEDSKPQLRDDLTEDFQVESLPKPNRIKCMTLLLEMHRRSQKHSEKE